MVEPIDGNNMKNKQQTVDGSKFEPSTIGVLYPQPVKYFNEMMNGGRLYKYQNSGRSVTDFQQLADKYRKYGWDALSQEEQASYRQSYEGLTKSGATIPSIERDSRFSLPRKVYNAVEQGPEVTIQPKRGDASVNPHYAYYDSETKQYKPREGNIFSSAGQGLGAAFLGAGEVMNTPIAMGAELLSGRNDYRAALPNMKRAANAAGILTMDPRWDDPRQREQLRPALTAGQLGVSDALGIENPYLAAGVDFIPDLLTMKPGVNLIKKAGNYGKRLIQDVRTPKHVPGKLYTPTGTKGKTYDGGFDDLSIADNFKPTYLTKWPNDTDLTNLIPKPKPFTPLSGYDDLIIYDNLTEFKPKLPTFTVDDKRILDAIDDVDNVKKLTTDPRYMQRAKALDKEFNKTVKEDASYLIPKQNKQNTAYSYNEIPDIITDYSAGKGINYNPAKDLPPWTYTKNETTGPAYGSRQNYFDYVVPNKEGIISFEEMVNRMNNNKVWSQQGLPFNTVLSDDYLEDFARGIYYPDPKGKRIPLPFSNISNSPGIVLGPNARKGFTLPHELKHFESRGNKDLPKKYKENFKDIFKDFSKKGDNLGNMTDEDYEYYKYRTNPTEIDAWISRNWRQELVNEGVLKDHFDELTPEKYNNWKKSPKAASSSNLSIEMQNLIKDDDKFLKWFNKALPVAGGVGTAGVVGAMSQPKEEYQEGGYTTKLSPNEEFVYQNWKKSLPSNLQKQNPKYDLRGAWKSGEQPELFYRDEEGNFMSAHPIDVNKQGSIYEPHLFSKDPKTGNYLKSPNHPSYMNAIEGDIRAGYTPYIDAKTGRMYSQPPKDKMIGRFNTRLNKSQLDGFNKHSALFPSLDADKAEYDTQGFYKNLYKKNKGNFDEITKALTPSSETAHVGHDRFKKPNHPTFSKMSKYYIPLLRNAGKRKGDYFNASKRNINNMNKSVGSPIDYFNWAEDYDGDGKSDVGLKYKGNVLIEPQNKYQNGGTYNPIYVKDANDPRYKSYSDSLNLYNNARNEYYGFDQQRQDGETSIWGEDFGQTDYEDNAIPLDKMGPGIDIHPYYKQKIDKSKIKPTGFHFSNMYYTDPVYKKPVQPYVVKPKVYAGPNLDGRVYDETGFKKLEYTKPQTKKNGGRVNITNTIRQRK